MPLNDKICILVKGCMGSGTLLLSFSEIYQSYTEFKVSDR